MSPDSVVICSPSCEVIMLREADISSSSMEVLAAIRAVEARDTPSPVPVPAITLSHLYIPFPNR